MKFDTKQDAFNHYRTATVAEIEQRAAEIKAEVSANAGVDIDSLNIELDGLALAKENATTEVETRAARILTSADFATAGSFEATQGDVLSSAEYRSAFFKSLLDQKLNDREQAAMTRAFAERRADAWSTQSDVAAAIPTQTLNEVLVKARDMGGMISLARQFNVPANIEIPIATPAGAASWNTEGAAVETGEPAIAQVSFGAMEIIKAFSISAAVRRMSVPAFEAYIADELSASVMACIANSLVNGTGTNEGTGVLGGITWRTSKSGSNPKNHVQVAAGGSIAYADIVSTMALLKRGYSNNAKFVMNQTTLLNSIYSLADDNERPLFIEDAQNDTVGKILGHEVVLDDFMPDDTIVYGDFRYLGFNMVDGIAVESSTQSSFKAGRVDYRGMAIADTKPLIAEAFVKLSIASS